MTFGIPTESLDKITGLLNTYHEIDKAVVFGSRATDSYKNGSDIDIALFGANISPKVVMDVSAALNERLPLPYYFDVVDYSSIKERKLIEHIDEFGKALYSKQGTSEEK